MTKSLAATRSGKVHEQRRREARTLIGAFLEKVYNQKRLHSALHYLPPAECERKMLAQTQKEATA